MLIFITILLITSIREEITESIETEYNDYYIKIGNLPVESFNNILSVSEYDYYKYPNVKIRCGNIISFSNYINKVIDERTGEDIYAVYYTLEPQEKIIYVYIIELILKVIITAIIVIGIVSTITILTASLCERK